MALSISVVMIVSLAPCPYRYRTAMLPSEKSLSLRLSSGLSYWEPCPRSSSRRPGRRQHPTLIAVFSHEF